MEHCDCGPNKKEGSKYLLCYILESLFIHSLLSGWSWAVNFHASRHDLWVYGWSTHIWLGQYKELLSFSIIDRLIHYKVFPIMLNHFNLFNQVSLVLLLSSSCLYMLVWGPKGALVSASGMDHVRVHPKFLHSNATSHKWALGGKPCKSS